MINVSTRLLLYARRVLDSGADELIAAVESGELAVSTAAALVVLPKQEQAQIVAAGTEAAAKARELRGVNKPDQAEGSSPGSFGIVQSLTPGARACTGGDDVSFLWVTWGGSISRSRS